MIFFYNFRCFFFAYAQKEHNKRYLFVSSSITVYAAAKFAGDVISSFFSVAFYGWGWGEGGGGTRALMIKSMFANK